MGKFIISCSLSSQVDLNIRVEKLGFFYFLFLHFLHWLAEDKRESIDHSLFINIIFSESHVIFIHSSCWMQTSKSGQDVCLLKK